MGGRMEDSFPGIVITAVDSTRALALFILGGSIVSDGSGGGGIVMECGSNRDGKDIWDSEDI